MWMHLRRSGLAFPVRGDGGMITRPVLSLRRVTLTWPPVVLRFLKAYYRGGSEGAPSNAPVGLGLMDASGTPGRAEASRVSSGR